MKQITLTSKQIDNIMHNLLHDLGHHLVHNTDKTKPITSLLPYTNKYRDAYNKMFKMKTAVIHAEIVDDKLSYLTRQLSLLTKAWQTFKPDTIFETINKLSVI